MENIQNKLIVLFFVLLSLPQFGFSQDEINDALRYEVNRIDIPFSITREQIIEAKSIVDLNKHYKSTWVKEFISLEILTTNNGKTKKAVSGNDVLSKEQKNNIYTADANTEISLVLHYIPDNTLKDNPARQFDFKFRILPENEAKYIGGQEELRKYLKENAVDKISASRFKELHSYNLAAVKFMINEKGEISNAHVFQSSKDEEIDELLLTAIRKMPSWKPAEYTNGLKVKQEFALTIGDHRSCVINLVSYRTE